MLRNCGTYPTPPELINGTYIAVWWVFNISEEDLLGVDFTTNGEQVKEVLENGRKNIT